MLFNVLATACGCVGLLLGINGWIVPIDSSGIDMIPLVAMMLLTALLATLSWFPVAYARSAGGGLLATSGRCTFLLSR